MAKTFTKYEATYYNMTVDKEGEKKYRDLGSKTFMYFHDSKVTPVAKAYQAADKNQIEANAVLLTVVK